MAGTSIGSTMSRRQLGRHLRALRERAKLRTTDAAKAMDWSQPTISRLETGHTPIRAIDVGRMCQLYGADKETTVDLVALAGETRAPDWWEAYGEAVPSWLELLLGLEQVASRFRWYEGHLIPGIFQTPRYALELMRYQAASMAEMRVKLRMERQALLTRGPNPPQYHVLVDEGVLHRPMAGPEVMAEQLHRLIEVSRLPNVILQVLPYTAGCHDGLLAGPFLIMDFPQDNVAVAEPSTVFLEGFNTATYFDRSQTVAGYVDAFNSLRRTALDKDASTKLVTQVARSLQ